MAEKAKHVEKKSRIREFIEKDYRYENLLLAVLSIFSLELGVLLLTKVLTIPEDAFLIGGAVPTKVFSWILVALGAVSLVLSVSSFYAPSFAEVKHVTGLKRSEFFGNVLKVLLFSIVLAFFFFLCDLLIKGVIDLLGPVVNGWLGK